MAKVQCCEKPYIIEDTVFHKYGSSETLPPEGLITESSVDLLSEDSEELLTEG